MRGSPGARQTRGGLGAKDAVASTGITSPLTTKGDIWVYSTVDTRLGSASANDGDVLLVDSAAVEGLVWGAPSVAISSLQDAQGTNVVDLANLTQTWRWQALAGTGLTLSSTSTTATGNAQRILNVALAGANANALQTTVAARFSNTHTGTTSTNIAARFEASGGTTNNFSIHSLALGLFERTTALTDIFLSAIRLQATTTGTFGGSDAFGIDQEFFLPDSANTANVLAARIRCLRDTGDEDDNNRALTFWTLNGGVISVRLELTNTEVISRGALRTASNIIPTTVGDQSCGTAALPWGSVASNLYNANADGTAAAPTYTWNADPNTGLFRVTTDTAALSAGGSTLFQWALVAAVPQLAFFGAATVARQAGGGALVADLVYTQTEADMLNAMYPALRLYGLLT